MSKIRLGDSVRCYVEAVEQGTPILAFGKTEVLSDPLLIVGIFRSRKTMVVNWMVSSNVYVFGFEPKWSPLYESSNNVSYQYIEDNKILNFTKWIDTHGYRVGKIIRATA